MKHRQKWLPIIDADRCSGCASCVNLCVTSCLGIPIDRAVLHRPEDCTGDGLCMRVCPQDAIEMGWAWCEEGENRAPTTRSRVRRCA